MKSYIVLLRGINVGGKNRVPMRKFKRCLEEHGFAGVVTYIQSGNAIVRSRLGAEDAARKIEAILQKEFVLDSVLVRTLALERGTYRNVIADAPKGFGG